MKNPTDDYPTFHTDAEKNVLSRARQEFLTREDVLRVRMGYLFKNGWITSGRAIVIVVRERKEPEQLASEHIAMLPASYLGYPVEVSGPTLADLVRNETTLATLRLQDAEITGGAGRYFPPPGATLKKITGRMKVKAAVSPESGWKVLRSFLKSKTRKITVGMYDFGAPHVVQSFVKLAGQSAFEQLTLAIQVGSNVGEGTKKDDLDDAETVAELERNLGTRFRNAWVRVGRVHGWVASSYHIKVAVSDSKRVFLSSGNWQSSNLPDLEALENTNQEWLLNTYNRDWHIVLENKSVAAMYEQFLLHDYEQNKENTLARELLAEQNELYFLVPATELDESWQSIDEPASFDPFIANRSFTVTPILSPDNYFEEVLALVQSAEHELFIQNQTFNAPSESQAKLRQLVEAVLQKQQQEINVKIIFRNFIVSDARENLEALMDMGFDPASIKVHNKCHTKGIIVDGRRVLTGSQNWSGDGVSVNRDASLLFDDEELAGYFRAIFLHDWEKLARHQIGSERINLQITTKSGSVPAGMKRVSWNDLLELL